MRGAGVLRFLSLAAPVCLAGSAHATAPSLLFQDRGVFASASALETGQADAQALPDEASDFAPFQASVSPAAATSDAASSSTADLLGKLEGSSLVAAGSVGSSAQTVDSDARAAAPSDAFFEVVFAAVASEPFFLDASLEADAAGGDAYASVELFDLDAALSVASHEVGPGESDAFSDGGMLQAGVTYRLTAFALSNGDPGDAPGTSGGDARFEVALALPEPGPAAPLAAGAALQAALLGIARSRAAAAGRGRTR